MVKGKLNFVMNRAGGGWCCRCSEQWGLLLQPKVVLVWFIFSYIHYYVLLHTGIVYHTAYPVIGGGTSCNSEYEISTNQPYLTDILAKVLFINYTWEIADEERRGWTRWCWSMIWWRMILDRRNSGMCFRWIKKLVKEKMLPLLIRDPF